MAELSRLQRKERISSISLICVLALICNTYPCKGHCEIVTGRIAPDAVNIADSVATGKEPMKQFETGWQGSVYVRTRITQ